MNTITLEPPPLVLVHGVWSSAAKAWPPFQQWLSSNYPHNLIFTADYGQFSSKAFSDSTTQMIFLTAMTNALASAAGEGVAARKVDVVAHSMGGLVTRFFLDNGQPFPTPYLPTNPVHKFIEIGSPNTGTALASTLWINQNTGLKTSSPIVQAYCLLILNCSLGNVMGRIGDHVDTAVASLQLGMQPDSTQYNSIVGQAPPGTVTESLLDVLIGGFLPGQTITSILGSYNDTIVATTSQQAGAAHSVQVNGIVHAALVPWNTGETQSPEVWNQALYWLMGGAGYAPFDATRRRFTKKSATRNFGNQPDPILDLSGYTQVNASNATVNPPNGSTLTINSTINITASSSTKSITEVLLLQATADPTDMPLLYSTMSPFSISYTPTRMGAASFAAITVFSDMTYAVTPLQYTLQPNGIPVDLKLTNVPEASLPIGISTIVEAKAGFSNGAVDVSQAAAYSAASGTSSVFSIGQNGNITAKGNGVDTLDVTYNGKATSAQISVGTCAYTLSPVNQVVDVAGGTINVAVSAPTGCAWTASGGDTWLTFGSASGSGNGMIVLTAVPNATASPRVATVSLADQTVAITQPATSCTYALNPTSIQAPSTGASGTIQVTTSCPVVASSDSNWLTAVAANNGVFYNIASNPVSSQRQGTITIGTRAVLVTQAPGAQSFTLAISVLPTVAGSVLATPLPTDGVYASGTKVCLKAFPNTGWGFSFWSGDVLDLYGCLYMTANRSVTAHFSTREVKLSATSEDFGTLRVGKVSASRAVTLSNIGNTAVLISNISIQGKYSPGFTQTNNCGTSVPAYGSCRFILQFRPTTPGRNLAILSINDSDSSSPQRVSLRGLAHR